MKINKHSLSGLILAIATATASISSTAQPALSKLPQDELPVISEQAKEIIRQQWTADDAAAKRMNFQKELPMPAPETKSADRVARGSTESDNIANQQAYIDELKRRAPERAQNR